MSKAGGRSELIFSANRSCRTRSSFDSHTLPKRNAALDFLGRGFRVGIIPSSILIPHAVYFDVVVIRGTLPRADGCVITGLEKFFLHCIKRKILVPFHDHARIAFGYDSPGPRRFRHFVPRRANSLSTEYRCQAKLSRCETRERRAGWNSASADGVLRYPEKTLLE